MAIGQQSEVANAHEAGRHDVQQEAPQELLGWQRRHRRIARRLVVEPHLLDVVVLPNLYGDILSDTAAGLIGGLGLAPSGCYGDDYAYFESAHGSAPDIAGQNIINPTATLLSAAMMLEHLGWPDAARRLESAITQVYAAGRCATRDQGGSATTTEFCAAIAERL